MPICIQTLRFFHCLVLVHVLVSLQVHNAHEWQDCLKNSFFWKPSPGGRDGAVQDFFNQDQTARKIQPIDSPWTEDIFSYSIRPAKQLYGLLKKSNKNNWLLKR